MSGLSLSGFRARVDGFEVGPFDFDLGPGEALALIGPSGAGKTTLLRAIAGFVPSTAGELSLAGSSLIGRPPESRGAGYVPQGLGLFDDRSVARNVGYPLEIRGRADRAARVDALLWRWGLASKAGLRPGALSGGERQRVAMARAAAAEPELLLWDEPLSALDVESRAELVGVVRSMVAEARVPLVLVTHDAPTAFSVADRFLVLRGGRSIYLGPAEGLAAPPLDRFVARFLGLENIWSPEEIAEAAPPKLARDLAAAAGPGGLAARAEAVRPRGPGDGGGWPGTWRELRRGPFEAEGTLSAGRLLLRSRWELGGAPPPRVGDPARFEIDPAGLRPLKEGAG